METTTTAIGRQSVILITMNVYVITSSLLAAAFLLEVAQAEDRPILDQLAERLRLIERDFELMISQFGRTVLGMDVHNVGSNVLNQSPPFSAAYYQQQQRTGRADPAADNSNQVLPIAIPGMDTVTQLASTGGNPLAILQQLFMGILMQFQSILRTLTSLPGSEILGR